MAGLTGVPATSAGAARGVYAGGGSFDGVENAFMPGRSGWISKPGAGELEIYIADLPGRRVGGGAAEEALELAKGLFDR